MSKSLKNFITIRQARAVDSRVREQRKVNDADPENLKVCLKSLLISPYKSWILPDRGSDRHSQKEL